MKKLEKAKITPLTDWLEDQVGLQQMCDSGAAITSAGQQSRPPNSAVVCVHLAVRERAKCISAPYVLGPVRGALFCRISHTLICRTLKIVSNVCCDKIVIQGATDLLQQPELCE